MTTFTQQDSQEVRSKTNNKDRNYFFTKNCIPISNADNKSDKESQMNIFMQKSKAQKETEILKSEVRKILRDEYILFTEHQFGIYINMTNIQYRIVFSGNPSIYRIYAGDLEIGNSYLQVENQFEALYDTIMDINIFFDDVLPFNVYTDNWEVA